LIRKLRERQRIEGEIDKEAHLLRTRFGSSGGELEDELRHWQERAEALAPADEEAVISTYDAQIAADVESQRQDLEETIIGIKDAMARYRDEMDAVGREATSVLARAEPVLVDTGLDLDEVEKAVTGFVRQVDERMQLCLEAIGILEEIEQEEGQQVATLLGTSSDISTMFGEITGGRYRQVGFDPEAGTIWAETDQGSRLEASCLSKGAYDQLYLAIRLSLARKLLGDETGFLLLDDPFLASDSERLTRQLRILHSLVGRGWQVIYLTVKG
jgi:exonuclease SbcC